MYIITLIKRIKIIFSFLSFICQNWKMLSAKFRNDKDLGWCSYRLIFFRFVFSYIGIIGFRQSNNKWESHKFGNLLMIIIIYLKRFLQKPIYLSFRKRLQHDLRTENKYQNLLITCFGYLLFHNDCYMTICLVLINWNCKNDQAFTILNWWAQICRGS